MRFIDRIPAAQAELHIDVASSTTGTDGTLVVTFASAFPSTPRITVTPRDDVTLHVTSASASSFVVTASSPGAYAFDHHAVEAST